VVSHLGLPKVDWSWPVMATLLPTAFAMFVVILAQSAATSRAFATLYDDTFSENTDLVGLALANIGRTIRHLRCQRKSNEDANR
jgi:MFS superfamily sulfate permease-like transporter